MAKRKIKLSSLIQPGDFIAALVVAVGVIIAVFFEGTAVKLIGVCIAVLGLVALFMLISQRLSEMVDSGRFTPQNPPPKFEMTVKKDSAAVRQTIENFDNTFGNSTGADTVKEHMSSDEGFRIVNKSDKIEELKRQNEKLEPEIIKSVPDAERDPESPKQVILPVNTIIEVETKTIDRSPVKIEDKPKPVSQSEGPAYDLKAAEAAKIKAKEVEKARILAENTLEEQLVVEKTATSQPILDISETVEAKEETVTITEPIIEEIKETVEKRIDPELEIDSSIIEQKQEFVVTEEIKETVAVNNDIPESDNNVQLTPETGIKQAAAAISAEPVLTINVAPISETVQLKEEEEKRPCKEKHLDVPLSVLMEDIDELGREPRKEFEYLLSRVLLIIRSVINTRTAAFILVNNEKSELILESYVTNLPQSITPNVKLPFGNDVVSQIISNSKPEILTEINPSAELDLIPYYITPVGVSSFVGVPVFYNNAVIGILCADTDEADAYDSATVGFIGHFTKLISALVHSYTDKYDLLQSHKTLDALKILAEITESGDYSYSGISDALVESATRIFDIKNAGVLRFDENRGNWFVTNYRSQGECPDYIQNEPVDLQNTLIGEALISCRPVILPNIDGNRLRVSSYEEANLGGYFISVPIKSESNTYGSFFIEGVAQTAMNNYDITILETLGSQAGAAIERLHLINMLSSSASIDLNTGMNNTSAFLHQMEREIARAADFEIPVTLCLFSIDKYASFDPEAYKERKERVDYHVMELIRKNLRLYDVFGKINDDTFAVMLIGVSSDQAKLWSERVRNSAAISVLDINEHRFTVTLSIGLTGVYKNDTSSAFLGNAQKALDIAMSKTNSVHVFN